MEITLSAKKFKRATVAPPSKSVYHRALICAALSGKETKITPLCKSQDILATVGCLRAMGVKITQIEDGYIVKCENYNESANLDCNECGSTLRFMLPLCAALGINANITGSEGLANRPLFPLDEILSVNGVRISKNSDKCNLPLKITGKLEGNIFEIPGNISSQYISGMMFALVARNKSATIKITGKIESAPYIDITVSMLNDFGFAVDKLSEREYHINYKRYSSPDSYTVEGDFSNAAFWLCAGAIADKGSELICKGINFTSKQGDKKIIEILEKFGSKVDISKDTATITADTLSGIEIDVSDFPDLVPVLSVVASLAKGKTVFKNVKRLKIKESNRVVSTVDMINALGGNATYDENNIYVNGVDNLTGGTVNSVNDHRIAMSAAIASTVCRHEVTIEGAEAVNKSYPTFFNELSYYTKE